MVGISLYFLMSFDDSHNYVSETDTTVLTYIVSGILAREPKLLDMNRPDKEQRFSL